MNESNRLLQTHSLNEFPPELLELIFHNVLLTSEKDYISLYNVSQYWRNILLNDKLQNLVNDKVKNMAKMVEYIHKTDINSLDYYKMIDLFDINLLDRVKSIEKSGYYVTDECHIQIVKDYKYSDSRQCFHCNIYFIYFCNEGKEYQNIFTCDFCDISCCSNCNDDYLCSCDNLENLCAKCCVYHHRVCNNCKTIVYICDSYACDKCNCSICIKCNINDQFITFDCDKCENNDQCYCIECHKSAHQLNILTI